jgi:DNA-binding MarR family transcriptional regulator
LGPNVILNVSAAIPAAEALVLRDHRPERRILRAIRRIIRSVDIYSSKLATGFGVTVPQLTCLLRVVEIGPLTLKRLAEEVDLSASTLVGIIDRLEGKGLVRRERSRTDRRQVLISTTEAGLALASGSPTPLQDRLATALKTLPELDQAAIAVSLERIVDLMQIHQVPAAPILDTGVSLELHADPGLASRREILS